MNDSISRQAAIVALRDMAVPLSKDHGCEDIWERDRTLDNAIDVIRELPAAQPEQVEPCSVSLIEKREQVEGWYYRKIFCCAKCGMKIRTETWGEKRCFGKSTILKDNSMPRYCPNCGAKMEE